MVFQYLNSGLVPLQVVGVLVLFCIAFFDSTSWRSGMHMVLLEKGLQEEIEKLRVEKERSRAFPLGTLPWSHYL